MWGAPWCDVKPELVSLSPERLVAEQQRRTSRPRVEPQHPRDGNRDADSRCGQWCELASITHCPPCEPRSDRQRERRGIDRTHGGGKSEREPTAKRAERLMSQRCARCG